jgi:riboflavin kinase/FMN adenylyltransferase
MLNQGPKPTFGETRRSVEVHLFGVNADLYGQWVRVEWVERLRDVTRFGSVGELTAQLERDRVAAQAALERQASLDDLTRAARA